MEFGFGQIGLGGLRVVSDLGCWTGVDAHILFCGSPLFRFRFIWNFTCCSDPGVYLLWLGVSILICFV